MSDKYILDGKKAIPCDDLLEWAQWFETAKRGVAKTEMGDAKVSTVFIGMDHQWGTGPPLIFETMVFGGSLDGEQMRYSTWEEAEAGHEEMVKRIGVASNDSPEGDTSQK